ncbi:ABC transporter substrate-binding protein [Bosea sp. (in: a-proteobacteria)]|uniref:ABC transporter substrate-binding protein n=1 Tax=Bosea sp. (in: a-proteobacteria) TaxID=1871050 RepID=UPI002617349E|nr:ABC transporter substrate-binding protein [Bosea sp. (in: a-proteobacteria)]MCO5092934.1 ABC transporter substrate-binding protein [Bosea sp. (in: a-proteobacteria)]
MTAASVMLLALQWSGQAQAQAQAPIRIGILNDQSGIVSDANGKGSVIAAQMAVDDFGGKVLGRPIEISGADHQNKADIGASIARQWYDQGFDLVADTPNSAVALAVQEISKQKQKMFINVGGVVHDLSGKFCTPYSFHWMNDTAVMASVLPKMMVKDGAKKWYFIGANYTFGQILRRDATEVIDAAGGSVVGGVEHPIEATDFSSYIIGAKASGADVIALANAGENTANSLKQANEFGIGIGGKQKIAALNAAFHDIVSIGLDTAQGLTLMEPYYWDLNDETRAWSKRFQEKKGMPPSVNQASVYGAIMHYLKAVQAAGSVEASAVAAKMKELPVNDFMIKNGVVRPNGRLVRDVYVFQVKTPAESKSKFDVYKLVATIKGADAYKPLNEEGCPLIK